MAHPEHQRYWFIAASACGALGLAMIGAAAALAAVPHSQFAWTSHFMIIAYSAGAAALACFVLGIRQIRFPLAATQARQTLEPRYNQSSRYRHMIGHMTEHRIGIHNPAASPPTTGVRLVWSGMSPRPHVVNDRYAPQTPCPVPRVTGGDPGTGITLPSGYEELWVAFCTATAPDGTMYGGEFSPDYGSSGGNWHGTPWAFEPGGRSRLSYQVAADNMPPVSFCIVITAEDGQIRCDLEGHVSASA